MTDKNRLIEQLNDCDGAKRLAALTALAGAGGVRAPGAPYYVNNHIHTTYSFSPYSPTKAVYMAAQAGLETAGIMDHDAIAGAAEFIRAGRIAGLPTTVGVETRVDFSGTPFAGRLINNPDQAGVAYMALHGIPHGAFGAVDKVFSRVREARNVRNRAMTKRAAAFLRPAGVGLDFDRDVLPHSNYAEGGSVTERTICFAIACNIIEKTGRGAACVRLVSEALGLSVGGTAEARLLDAENVHYAYDLTGVLKGGMVKDFYLDAAEELLSVDRFIGLGREVGAIAAYAYLGDVGDSVTGDKKAQKFEDGYLEELFGFLRDKGVDAIAYMPSRNSGGQLKRLRGACADFGFFEISGEDINSSRQSFICPQLAAPEFAHLIPATWALLGHEAAATNERAAGMFSQETIRQIPDLPGRIAHFERLGRGK
jgi:hypothetical protein